MIRWSDAYRELADADAAQPLAAADLERFAAAAYLLGRDDEASALWRRAHHALLESDRPPRAAVPGFWLSFLALMSGDRAQFDGWLARIQRLLADHPSAAEHGYALALTGLGCMVRQDPGAAGTAFEQAIEIAARAGDRDLHAFALLGLGQSLILRDQTARGVSLLDEAMVAIASGEMAPILVGFLYCAVIITCHKLSDLERCREWTLALDRWCVDQPDLVPFRGVCLVHRAEILQLQGEWAQAIEQARRAAELNAQRDPRSAGRAFYQRGELHRLRGEHALADEMYREAGRCGCEPQPGLSLLRLAQGDRVAAGAASRRLIAEGGNRLGPGAGASRLQLLCAHVEVMLALDDVGEARAAADELAAIAARADTLYARAGSAHATGAVLLAEADPGAALPVLREAWTAWQQLDAPYEAARARVLIARACAALGDHDTARSHRDAAAAVFERLGAAPALAELDAGEAPATGDSSPLTAREREVLARVAAGDSNRQVAARLRISEHTVARHLSNIFTKLDVATRTAAVAWAIEHRLI